MRVTFDDLFKKIGMLVVENEQLRLENEALMLQLGISNPPVERPDQPDKNPAEER